MVANTRGSQGRQPARPRSAPAKRSGFVYTPRDPKLIKDRAERSGGRFDSIFKAGADVFRPKTGSNVIRILPPTWEDADHYAYAIYVHRNIGPDNSTYLCLNKHGKGKCPVCAEVKLLKDAGETEDAKQIQITEQFVCWICDRDADDHMPALYALSWTMDRDIAALCTDERTNETLVIDHDDLGYDVTIKRSGTGFKTKYFGLAIAREQSPVHDDRRDQDEVLAYIHDNPVPTMLNFYSFDYISNVMSGTGQEVDGELDQVEEEVVDERDTDRVGHHRERARDSANEGREARQDRRQPVPAERIARQRRDVEETGADDNTGELPAEEGAEETDYVDESGEVEGEQPEYVEEGEGEEYVEEGEEEQPEPSPRRPASAPRRDDRRAPAQERRPAPRDDRPPPRRPAPAPREERRPAPRDDRRPAAREERRPAPRDDRRPAPRDEPERPRRPAPATQRGPAPEGRDRDTRRPAASPRTRPTREDRR